MFQHRIHIIAMNCLRSRNVEGICVHVVLPTSQESPESWVRSPDLDRNPNQISETGHRAPDFLLGMGSLLQTEKVQ